MRFRDRILCYSSARNRGIISALRVNKKTMIKKIWSWLVVSSADPTKMSLTVKAFLAGIATLITYAVGLGVVHIGFAPDVLNQFIDASVQVVQAFFAFISAVAFAIGLARKIFNTLPNPPATPQP